MLQSLSSFAACLGHDLGNQGVERHKGSPVAGDPGASVVPLSRAIGTSGETSVEITVRSGTSQVITAHPVK